MTMMMGADIGPQSQSQSQSSPTTSLNSDTRPKSRGRGENGETSTQATNIAPSSFKVFERGSLQDVDSGSPSSTARPETGGSGSGSANGQPLKSAMKKPRDRPKSRPLILRDGKSGGFAFGLDPLGSNPRSPVPGEVRG